MTVTTPEQAIVLAYARLKGLRENINMDDSLVPGHTLWQDFNKAIADLGKAGFDLSDFAISNDDLVPNYGEMQVRPDVLRARVDALLIYFSVETGQTGRPRVGFEPPSKK
jgi:hypothetical protein